MSINLSWSVKLNEYQASDMTSNDHSGKSLEESLMLSNTFFISCLYGESAISEELPMQSFMNFVSESEKKTHSELP